MPNTALGRKRLLRKVNRLLDENPTGEIGALIRQLQARIRMPMSLVLDKVPGDNVAARAREIGVARQTYYSWFDGYTRPSIDQAKRLEKLTGIPIKQIRGRAE